MDWSSLLRDLGSNKGARPPESLDTARVWRKLHEYPEFQKASPDEQRGFLLFVLELVKRDLAIHMAGGPVAKSVLKDSRLFPIHTVCDPTESLTPVSFAGKTIVAQTYEIKKLIGAIDDIRRDGFRSSAGNYEGEYFPELELILVVNGVHHSAAAAILEGTASEEARCDIYHLADAYDRLGLSKDFAQWIYTNGETVPVLEPRFAMIYALAKELELGRGPR